MRALVDATSAVVLVVATFANPVTAATPTLIPARNAERIPGAIPPGSLVVADSDAGTASAGAVFLVNPTSGDRSILSDFGDPALGPVGADPYGLRLDRDGQVLVTDRNAGPTGRGALFRVDAQTGRRVMLSDFGDPSSGPLGVDPSGIATESDGSIVIADPEGGTNQDGAVYRVDPATGRRTLLSDIGGSAALRSVFLRLGDAGNPTGLDIDATGRILVADPGEPGSSGLGSGAVFAVNPTTGFVSLITNYADGEGFGIDPTGILDGGNGAVFVVDPAGATDARGAVLSDLPPVALIDPDPTVVVDFGDPNPGPRGVDPTGIAREYGGQLLVIDESAGLDARGQLFRVNVGRASRALISDFGDETQGPLGVNPVGVVADVTISHPADPGDPVFTTLNGGTESRGAVVVVDPSSGERSLLSDLGDPAQGPLGSSPQDIAAETGGQLLVVARDTTGTPGGWLFRIDPSTGQRTLVSDLHDAQLGPVVTFPSSVAVERDGSILVVDYSRSLVRVDPSTGIRTVVTDIGDPATGPLGADIAHVAVAGDGSIILTDLVGSRQAGGLAGAMYVVDPVTGQRAILSDFGDPTQASDPSDFRQRGLAGGSIVEPDGDVLTAMFSGPVDRASDGHPLLRVDRATGLRQIVVASQSSPSLLRSIDVAAESDGQLLLLQQLGRSDGFLIRADPASGSTAALSDFTDPTQGLSPGRTSGLAVVGQVEIPPLFGCGGSHATIIGTPGSDVLTGTPGPDTIVGLAGDDQITGLGGNDRICAGAGNDAIGSGSGDDVAAGGDGSDRIRGRTGADRALGGAGRDVILAGSGDDQATGQAGNDFVGGYRDDDQVIGGSGTDVLRGGQGIDRLVGGGSADRLTGGANDDALNGGIGVDRCRGGLGTDIATHCETVTDPAGSRTRFGAHPMPTPVGW